MVRQTQKQKIVIGTPPPSKTRARKAPAKRKPKRARKKPTKRKRAAGVGQRQSQSVNITLGGAQGFSRAPWVFAPPFQPPGPPPASFPLQQSGAAASETSDFVSASDLAKVARAIADLEKKTQNILNSQEKLNVENEVANAQNTAVKEMLDLMDAAPFWEAPPAPKADAPRPPAPPPAPRPPDMGEDNSMLVPLAISAAGLAAVGGGRAAADLLTGAVGAVGALGGPLALGAAGVVGGSALLAAVNSVRGSGTSLAEEEGFAEEPAAAAPVEEAVVDIEPEAPVAVSMERVSAPDQPTGSFFSSLNPWASDSEGNTPLTSAVNNPLPVPGPPIGQQPPATLIPAAANPAPSLRRRSTRQRRPPAYLSDYDTSF